MAPTLQATPARAVCIKTACARSYWSTFRSPWLGSEARMQTVDVEPVTEATLSPVDRYRRAFMAYARRELSEKAVQRSRRRAQTRRTPSGRSRPPPTMRSARRRPRVPSPAPNLSGHDRPRQIVEHNPTTERSYTLCSSVVAGDGTAARVVATGAKLRPDGGGCRPRASVDIGVPGRCTYASWYSANSHGCGRSRIASTSASRL